MTTFNTTQPKIKLLQIIHSFKFIPIYELKNILIKQNIYSHKDSAYRIIRQLNKQNLIRTDTLGIGNSGKVVCLTAKGAEFLANGLGISRKEVISPSYEHLKFLKHPRMLVDIYIKLLENFNLINWFGDKMTVCEYSFWVDGYGKRIARKLMPDGYFEIEVNGKLHKFFLEYDTGTMGVEKLQIKFAKYFGYFIHGDWQERFKEFPKVLFLTDRSDEDITKLTNYSTEELEQTLDDYERKGFKESKNIIWGGVATYENFTSISSDKIREFLENDFIFYHNNLWIEKLQKFLS